MIEKEVRQRYRVKLVGHTKEIRQRFYAISVERKIRDPAVLAICEVARSTFSLEEKDMQASVGFLQDSMGVGRHKLPRGLEASCFLFGGGHGSGLVLVDEFSSAVGASLPPASISPCVFMVTSCPSEARRSDGLRVATGEGNFLEGGY